MSDSRHSDDTVNLPKMTEEDDDNTKKCCNCGKDLRGHRRFKDSVGYWCKDCHRVDKARNTVPEARCPDCGRMRPLDKLFTVDEGVQVCSSCKKERQKQAEKYEVQAATEAAQKWEEQRKLYIMGGILALLAVIWLIQMIVKHLR